MSDLKGCFSHNTDDWCTPTYIYNYYMNLGYVDCFPYQSNYDELQNDYYDEKLFVNPPYSKLTEVTTWLLRQLNHNCTIVLLIPARTDTKYFHALLVERPTIMFLKGRLHFGSSKHSAPFPSIMLILDRKIRTNNYLAITDPIDYFK